ncbi:MAG: cbb3-type cytochrome c oxidase subunit 3 [Proteobacteria bacterium]|nr:cbb3-type cytochrome c oxidase subunit 3 [Pseudomonadota bacterium]
MISGIVTIILLVSFLGVIAWAWSDRRKEDFDHLANLPLDDDWEITDNKGDKNGND